MGNKTNYSDWEQTTINERIKYIVDYFFKGNTTQMAKAVFVKQSTLRDIVGERNSTPSFDTIKQIVDSASLNINPEWLLTGRGEILKAGNSVKIFVPEDLPKQVGRLYRAPIYESYPVSAGLHGLAAIRDDKPDGYAYTTMPGVTFFPVIGCSFEPIIYAGEYIGVVKLNSWDRVDTEKIYFILTKEERMLKRLKVDKDREDILWCVSPNFSEFSILKSDIIEINHVFFYGKMI
jgi:hypothetical protein